MSLTWDEESGTHHDDYLYCEWAAQGRGPYCKECGTAIVVPDNVEWPSLCGRCAVDAQSSRRDSEASRSGRIR